jgi:hypothetical protein
MFRREEGSLTAPAPMPTRPDREGLPTIDLSRSSVRPNHCSVTIYLDELVTIEQPQEPGFDRSGRRLLRIAPKQVEGPPADRQDQVEPMTRTASVPKRRLALLAMGIFLFAATAERITSFSRRQSASPDGLFLHTHVPARHQITLIYFGDELIGASVRGRT